MTPLEITPLPRALGLSTHFRGGYCVAALRGELDFASVPELRDQLLNVLRLVLLAVGGPAESRKVHRAAGACALRTGPHALARVGPRERTLTSSPLPKQPERVPDQV